MKNIEAVFDLLDEWREFPSYQLERRADIYFALFLPEIMKQFFHEDIKHEDIIPEFPLKNKNRQDFRPLRVDYVVFGSKFVYFIELKTSMSSWSPAQDDNMKAAKDKGLAKVIEEAKEISKRSRSGKYCFFNRRLDDLMKKEPMIGKKIKIVYIQPENPEKSKNIKSFEQIIQLIDSNKDKSDLEIRFRDSLARWIPEEKH